MVAMRDVLAIVGSVRFVCPLGLILVRGLVHNELQDRRPDQVVSGGAVGVDTVAVDVADLHHVPWHEFLPANKRWEPDGFKARNLQIVEACTRLLAIRCAEAKTYGSGWTCDRARDLGKPTRTVTIGRDGTVEDTGWLEPAPTLI